MTPRSTGFAMRCTNTVSSVVRHRLTENPVDWARVIVTLKPLEEAVALLGSAAADCNSDESVNYLLFLCEE